MSSPSTGSKEIWGLIKETQKNLKEVSVSHKEAKREMKEIRASQKEFQAAQKKLQAAQKEFQAEFQAAQKKLQAEFQAAQKEFQAGQKEFQAGQKELQAAQKEFQAGQKELQAAQKETDKQLKKTDARFNTQWGKLVESLVEGKLVEMLNERGIEVLQTNQRTTTSYRKEDGQIQDKEFDILAVNGKEIVVVEVKTTLRPSDVSYFLEAVRNFKKYCTQYKSHIVYGAVAYLKSESEARLFAERRGLFVIRATGDSASIINRESFKPKAFP